jgi:glycosyltransferase involved in cell wall biosynthesis
MVSRWTVDKIVYCSDIGRRQHEEFGYDASKSLCIHNGVDVDTFRPDESARCRIRAQLGLTDDDFVIGNVARLHPTKNHLSLVRAFLAASRTCPRIHLVMVGKDVTWEKLKLHEYLPGENLSGQIHLLEEQSNLHRIFPGFDLYVSPSLAEAFPVVLVEAMASGVPCLTSDAGDSRDIVGDVGTVISKPSAELIAAEIVRYYEMPRTDRMELAAQGREIVVTRFGLQAMTSEYSTLYKELAGNRGPSR